MTHDPFDCWRGVPIDLLDCLVSVSEVMSAIRGGGSSGNPVPGPDSIPICVWRSISPAMASQLTSLYAVCLKEGNFPLKDCKVSPYSERWVFFSGQPIKAQPICLLNEVSKIFKRILAARINFMEDSPLVCPAINMVFVLAGLSWMLLPS